MALLALCVLTPASASAGTFVWRSQTVATGRAFTPAVVSQLSCPSASECVGVDSLGGIAWTRGVGATPVPWHLTAPLEQTVTFASISCPSARLCVALDQAGGAGQAAHIAVSTDPTGTARDWTVIQDRALNSVQDVACPTVKLCVVDTLDGLFVSTDPTGGASTWKPELTQPSNGSGDLTGWVSCPSSTLCVVVTDDGNVYTSSRPAGGTATWHRSAAFPKLLFDYVDCPSISLCVGLDNNGEVVSSTDPGAADPHWVDDGSISGIADNGPTVALSCTPAGVCVTVDAVGTVYVTADGAGPASAWSVEPKVDPAGFGSVTCQPNGSCLAPDLDGGIATSAAPAAAAPDWQISAPLGMTADEPFTGISCPSLSLCLATAGGGHVASVRDPGSRHSWRVVTADPHGDLQAISCPSSHFCAAIGYDDALATSTDPTGAASAWKAVTLTLTWQYDSGESGNDDFSAIACPSAHECLAPDIDNYDIAASADPAGGARAWNANYGGQVDYDQFSGIACPAARLCVAVGIEGDVWTQQTDGHPTQYTASGGELQMVSCPTVSFCVATGTENAYAATVRYVYVGSPTGRRDWKAVLVEPDHVDGLTDVACASTHLCAAVDDAGRVFVSSDPAGGSRDWHATTLDPGHSLNAIACPSAALCIALGDAGRVFIGKPSARRRI